MRLVVPLLPLVSGCGGIWCGAARDMRFTPFVPREEFDAALDDDGQLTEAACFDLCIEGSFVFDVKERLTCGVGEATATNPTFAWDTAEATIVEGHEDGVVLDCTLKAVPVCKGRGHVSIVHRSGGTGPDRAAAWLAAGATAEASSVQAFLALRRELATLGAPEKLLDRCSRAAIEEVVHARLLTRLAVARGGVPHRPRFVPTRPRGALELAVENAVEGLVGERWGATIAAWQAVHASDPDIRAAYARLAVDELSHAALSVDIGGWLDPRLDAAGRATVAQARSDARARIEDGLTDEPDLDTLGLPSRAAARELLAGV